MKKEYFVEQPNIDLKVGVRATKDTVFVYNNSKVEQSLKDLVLETILTDEGTNGINIYKTKSYIQINLNEGDILLFDEERGYYMSPYPMASIEDAINDVESLRGTEYKEEVNNDVSH